MLPPCSRYFAIGLRLLSFFILCLCGSCITEDTYPDTNTGNVEACWKLLDEHYCFFDLKQKTYGLDWNEVHHRYAHAVDASTNSRQLFETLNHMLCELRDGHVNLITSYDIGRYGAWFDNYPANFSDSLERATLGPTPEHHSVSGLQYRILPHNIGYVRVSSFDVVFGSGALNQMMAEFAACFGLIIDVRNNGGGMLTSAQKLAGLFINQPTVVGYMQHKTGKGHQDFSPLRPIEIHPFEGLRWQKPVCLLTNRRTYSAANSFVSYLRYLPQVTLIGDVTGGGGGLPFNSQLPNGWIIRFSACPMYDAHHQSIEQGIPPHLKIDITLEDYRQGKDTLLEKAIQRLIQQAKP